MDGSRILVFLDTKKGCDQITRQLRMDGWPALSIHGDKSQAERDWVLSEFRSGKSPIMTATDVAARGLGTNLFLFLYNINSLSQTNVFCSYNRRERCEIRDKLRLPRISGGLCSQDWTNR